MNLPSFNVNVLRELTHGVRRCRPPSHEDDHASRRRQIQQGGHAQRELAAIVRGRRRDAAPAIAKVRHAVFNGVARVADRTAQLSAHDVALFHAICRRDQPGGLVRAHAAQRAHELQKHDRRYARESRSSSTLTAAGCLTAYSTAAATASACSMASRGGKRPVPA